MNVDRETHFPIGNQKIRNIVERVKCAQDMSAEKRTIYVGGLADEVTDKLINAAFIPFGDIVDIQMPIDYESQKHRGFAFIEYETAEDAAAAIDNMVSEVISQKYKL